MKAGLIVRVVGACVDVQFRLGALPNLFDALIVEDLGLTLETHQHCEQAVVRTIALGPVEGLRRGMRVVSLDKPLSFPIGSGLLGRTLNGLGEPIDNLGPLKSIQRLPVRRQPRVLSR